MFDFVHEKKRIVQIILALVILPFAFWGMDSYNRSGNGADAVATVNDTKITQREFEYALRLQQNNLREMMGENFDVAMLNSPEMKRVVMDNLIEKRLLIENARDAGLAIPDEQLAQVIASIEAFQDNGNFDKQRYETALAGQGMSSLMFETRLRDDLLAQQVRDAYAQNGFVSNSVAENVIRLNEQQRTVSVSTLSFKPYLAQAKVDEAAVKEYYQQNQKAFRVLEQAKVEYVRFSVNDLMSRAEVSDEDARRYYEDRPNEFGTAEERQVAHILISAAASAPQAEQDAAKAKAEKLLQQVRQDPARFAELAKKHSQDPGSAANGGDLGFFGRGMMVKPFEDATFALKQDEISGLVKSDFGYHIIKLLAVKPARLLSFDEVQESILNKLRLQKATDLFAELAEKFNNTVYEQSDTLKPAADLVGATIEQSEWLDRETAPDGIWTAKMLQEIFSEETLKNKRNTAAIEVEANTLVAARILEYKPASMRTLDEVQETINQKLLREQAVTLAAKQGKALLEQLQRGDKPALDWEAAQTVTRARRGSLDADMIRKVFQADAASLPQFVGAETPQDGYLLVRIDAVKEGEKPDDERRAGYAQQIRQLTGEEMLRAYLADARQQATVAVNLPETTEQP